MSSEQSHPSAGVVATVAGVSLAVGAGLGFGYNALAGSEIPYHPEATVPPAACAEPTAESMAHAKTLLHNPFQADPALYSKYRAETFKDVFAAASLLARHNDVHLARPVIIQDNPIHPKTSQYYLETTNKELNQFGVSVEPAPLHDLQYGAHQPTKTEFNSSNSKWNLLTILNTYASLPKEYVALSGLKHIYLAWNMRSAAVAYEGPDADGIRGHNAITIDMKNNIFPLLLMHENYHALDAVLCDGNEGNDPAFASLNPGSYSDDKLTSYRDTYVPALTKLGNKNPEYCVDLREVDTIGKNTTTATDYHPNVVEDKAETGKYLTLSSDPLNNPTELPQLQPKLQLLLARLYQRAPGVATYFMQRAYSSYAFGQKIDEQCGLK